MKIQPIFFLSIPIILFACRNDVSHHDAGPHEADGGTHIPNDTDSTETSLTPFEGTSSGLTFNPPRGIYNDSLSLTISHESKPTVKYTLDGSDPRTSAAAQTASLPLTLAIDPTDTDHRHTAPGVVVRATADGKEALPEQVTTHTYLFLDQVIPLSPDGAAPGAAWPAVSDDASNDGWWGSFGSQRIDYGLDPDITESESYRNDVESAFRAIPSISLATDLSNLFDEETGIYMNAQERGEAWERPCSIELLSPDGAHGFGANAGVRIRGGYSRTGSNPKHAFRFFFRSEYGTPKLRYALFGEEGATEFDRIDVRTSQNYAWSGSNDDTYENTMNRDVFSRDLQRELGRPYTRSRYYHLFINGVYWGLFQSQERAENHFASTYLGGSKDDYDIVKTATDQDYTIEATDGSLDLWREVWDLAEQGFETDTNYYRLEGKTRQGERDPSARVLVDIDNLIDYMLVIFFTGNYDGPASKFFSNQNPNNFYAIASRVNQNQGFTFYAHDSEHSLMNDSVSITTGIDEDRVNIGEEGINDRGVTDSDYRMRVTRFEKFHPQWLHHRLTENAAYRARFAARAKTVLEDDGPMTPSRAVAIFRARADEIDSAIIAESARWGDAHRDIPRTRNDDWVVAVEKVATQFLSKRTDILISQLKDAGLY